MRGAARGVLAPLLALALAGCAGSATTAPAVTAPLGSAFTLRVGEEAEVEGAGLRVRFEGVAQDSRCPVDVTCVWAGDATVRLRAALGGAAARTLELHTGVEPRSEAAGEYRIELVGLEPAPRSDSEIPETEYAAEIRVSRGR